MAFTLSKSNAVDYLVASGLISQERAGSAVAAELGGGVSNIVVRVDYTDDAPSLVIKQSLPRLRVAQEWLADQARIHREAASLRYLERVLPHSTLPTVVHEDPDEFLFVMTAAPERATTWKDELLAGRVDLQIASSVGTLLGSMHQCSIVTEDGIPADLLEFADQGSFVQLRIDPYHRATALAHPDLAANLEAAAQAMLDNRVCMVHGDYSPKNVMVCRNDNIEPSAFLLDFEVVHLGNPVFDLAFMLNHLTLKAIHRRELAGQYNAAGSAFWSAYRSSAPSIAADGETLQGASILQMGALLLARIDGKSPAEYITTEREKSTARGIARAILAHEVKTLPGLHQALKNSPS